MSAGTVLTDGLLASISNVPTSSTALLKNAFHTCGSALSLLRLVMVASLEEVTLFGLQECDKRKPTLEDMLNGH